MKVKRIWILLGCSIVSVAFFLQCTRCTPLTDRDLSSQISLVSYNTQTFFDAVEDGTEFQEFRGGKSRWSEQRYRIRLERLKNTLFAAGKRLTGAKDRLPDIAVLQEVESSRVVEDFCKQLPHKETYPYALCPPRSDKAAFTTVILSKFPIEKFRLHTLYIQDQAALRPLVEAQLNIGTEQKPRKLTLFAVHWKSKSGRGESASIRILQEQQLLQKIREHNARSPDIPIVICGDFNQPLEEFRELNTLAVCWNTAAYKAQNQQNMQPGGSFYFKNRWEKIDHIFYYDRVQSVNKQKQLVNTGSAAIEPVSFFVLYEPPLVQDGKPLRYNVVSGEGYSDHLPLGFRFKILQ